MDKSELLADLGSMFAMVCTPRKTESGDSQVPVCLGMYSVLVYETGTSDDSKPLIGSQMIDFFVCYEGEENEAAYYVDKSPVLAFS